MLETLAIVGAFVGAGLGWAAALEGPAAPTADRAAPASYPAPVPHLAPEDAAPSAPGQGPEPEGDGPVWLVDGYNVIGVGLLAGRSREGWWRSERRRELVERAAAFDDPAARLWVVFDGAAPPAECEMPRAPHPRVVFAPSADDWLLARLRELRDPARVTVVTGDRRLAARARHRGAAVASPGAFLARCS